MLGELVGELRADDGIECLRWLPAKEVDGSSQGGFAAGGALRAPSYLNTLHIEKAVGTVGLVGPDAVDINSNRRVAEEIHGTFRTDPTHIKVVVFALTAALGSVADLQARHKHFQVTFVLDAQLLNHLLVEAGNRHGPIQDHDLTPFTRDDDLLEHEFGQFLILLGLLILFFLSINCRKAA